MPPRRFQFTDPERFVAGTVGTPGARTFYLQARQGAAVVSLTVEKVQVAALAARMADLLAAVNPNLADDLAPADDAPLDEPLIEAFRVGVLALAWDPAAERVVVEAQPVAEDDEEVAAVDEPEATDLFRVSLLPGSANEFVRRATELVVAGRPTCPYCGQAIDERGHLCPRANSQLN
jgi:uncharacterized repeat protein (TIGR03847 family)